MTPLRAVRAVAECSAHARQPQRPLERTWGVRLVNRTGVAHRSVVFADAGGGHRVLAGRALELASGWSPSRRRSRPWSPNRRSRPSVRRWSPTRSRRVTLKNGTRGRGGAPHQRRGRRQRPPTGRRARRPIGAPRAADPIDVTADPPWAWCPRCANPVARRGQKQASRRTLTIVFADLHPAAASPGDADASRHAMVRAFDELRGVLEHHGATVEKFIGDAVMAVFGLAHRREDDAVRAVRAALEMQATRCGGSTPSSRGASRSRLELRIGVNTGPVIAGDRDRPATGHRGRGQRRRPTGADGGARRRSSSVG